MTEGRRSGLELLAGAFLVAAGGCAFAPSRVTTIDFLDPRGGTLQLLGKEYRIPPGGKLRLRIPQWARVEDEEDAEPLRVRMRLADGTRLRGYLVVFATTTIEGELTVAAFRLESEHLERLKEGQPVVVSGYARNKEVLFRMHLGLDLRGRPAASSSLVRPG